MTDMCERNATGSPVYNKEASGLEKMRQLCRGVLWRGQLLGDDGKAQAGYLATGECVSGEMRY